MNTSYLVRIVLFVMLGVNLSNSSPLDRLKRSLTSQAIACPPGIWTCLHQKRDRMDVHPEKTIAQAVPLNNQMAHAVPLNNQMSAAGCPPGIWTCATLNQENKGSGNLQEEGLQVEGRQISINRAQPAKDQPSTNDNADASDELNKSTNKCPPGIWVCKKKRTLKKRMRQPNRVQRSAQKCPPGIWVC